VSQQDSERRQPDDERVVALHRATLTAIDFRRARFDRFSIGSCLFDRCDFRGLTIDRRLAPLFHAAPRDVLMIGLASGSSISPSIDIRPSLRALVRTSKSIAMSSIYRSLV